jgi:hypothetical protein
LDNMLRGILNHVTNNLITLFWSLKDVPYSRRNALESFLEPFWLILLGNTNGSDRSHFSNKDKPDPTMMVAISGRASWSAQLYNG